jgi:large subunit ribosomal protein L25
MKSFILKAYPREMLKTAAAKKYRKEGLIPAVLYSDGNASSNILIDAKAFNQEIGLRYRGYGIFNLEFENEKTMVYVKKIQINNVKQSVSHIEFYKITPGREVVVEVPLKLVNSDTCQGVKLGGIISKLSEYISVKVVPAKIPTYLEIDIKNLNINQSYSIKDIAMPEDVTVFERPEKAVVRVVGKKSDAVSSDESDESETEEKE